MESETSKVSDVDQAERAATEDSNVLPADLAYEYEALSEDNSNIRVLKIQPGRFDDDVYIHMLTIPFGGTGPSRQPYEALSYTWGNPQNPATIYIRDTGKVSTLSVTRNCEEALRYLRYEDTERVVWVDAICINQGDLAERARQVSIMRSIYSKAWQVVVWLGPASADSSLAMKWIDTVSDELAYDKSTQEMRALTPDTKRLHTEEVVIASADELEAFAQLIERPYFDRLWVWQEVRMGGEGVKVKCGHEEAFWEWLMTAVFYCNRKLINGDIGVLRLTPRTSFIRYLPLAGHFQSLDALDNMRLCKCSDQRDRIYTTQAFADTYTTLQIAIDYKVDVRDVYLEFALKHLLSTKNLEFLAHVGDDLPHPGEQVIDKLPSWVPNWSRRNTAQRLTMGFASGFSQASFIPASGMRLGARGLKVGTVAKSHLFGHDLLHPINTNVWNKAMHAPLQAILPREVQLQTAQSDPNDRKEFRQVVRVMTNDTCAEHYIPASSRPTFAQAERHVIAALWGIGPDILPPERAKIVMCFFNCRGRALFITEDGRIGLGPAAMQNGDVLAVLLGCPNIMVLRRLANEGHYSVIGTAVCSGLMDGEAILGPLPDDVETVNVLNQDTGAHLPAFRHTGTGELTYKDPRLPSLRPGWKDVSGDRSLSNAPLCWQHETTGEWRSYLRDPRLEVDALEERGVKLETFFLV
ncbi:hypothetical protein M409DRAFT_52689 [Zasmidium cellare ATCC 36951]|uniref:Heterokaryon incompatibility domain-containing protein n=1 Tax=Zasmidium cellare ATCC 36951 TaxID=1080233 RepID=A0A6A6CTG4_ZASCE|nr:uncharacterized protein M409DRAFT_52689 [Zasmidium cellare ATCC 36951]KAF2169450.1 hypothetical protein M409DRAFT_52689 [Zasmidium cellare ATCC 36951]